MTTPNVTERDKPKIYTFYTPSHAPMLQMFLNSFHESHNGQGVYIVEFPQECPTASFHAQGWGDTMKRKVEYVRYSIENNFGSWFVHADCDIIFTDDTLTDIERRLYQDDSVDMICQDDGMLCAGFFACKANKRTKDLYDSIWKVMTDIQGASQHDQIVMNQQIMVKQIRAVRFPRFEYLNYMHFYGVDTIWDGDENRLLKNLELNKDKLANMKMFHANYCIGPEKKIRMMEIVRDFHRHNIPIL